ncbi:MAG: hypothetical protein JO110_10770 [Acetobacteraceae bacterium]|nr:hypothetical protein [Acetobacteraceae bacterium]
MRWTSFATKPMVIVEQPDALVVATALDARVVDRRVYVARAHAHSADPAAIEGAAPTRSGALFKYTPHSASQPHFRP